MQLNGDARDVKPRPDPPGIDRVVFVFNNLRVGGSQTVYLELVRCAARAGFEPVVATKGGPLDRAFEKAGARCVRLVMREGTRWDIPAGAGVLGRLLSSVMQSATAAASLIGVLQLVRLLRGRSVVHASQPWPVSIAALACGLTGTPLLWHAHGTTVVETPPALQALVRRQARLLVGISPEVADALRVWAEGSGPVRALQSPCTVEDRPRHDSRRDAGGGQELADDDAGGDMGRMLKVGTCLTLGENKLKAVEVTIEAALLLAASNACPVLLTVVGSGPQEDVVARFACEAEEMEGNLAVELVTSTEDPWTVLEESDVVVGMGLVAVEAGLRGHRVVIVSSDGFGGVLSDENVRALWGTNYTGRSFGELDARAVAGALVEALAQARTPAAALAEMHQGRSAGKRFEEAWRQLIEGSV